jgi:hypothetical protein
MCFNMLKASAFILIMLSLSCRVPKSSQLQEESQPTPAADGLEALVSGPAAEELLNFDIDDENTLSDQIEVPSVAIQKRSAFYPQQYFGDRSSENLRIYREYLESDRDFKELHSALLEFGASGSQLLSAKAAYEENAQSITTNLPLGKGSEHWFKEAQKAQDMYAALQKQYSENGLDDLLIIGFSRFSDDMFQDIRGGTGFDAVVAAAEAQSRQWNDGLQSLGAGPFEFILGTGFLTSAGKSLARAAVKTTVIRASASYAKTFVLNSARSSLRAAVSGTRTLISKLIRSCVGLGLTANKECANHVVSNATGLFKHGWIKRSLFKDLRATAGPQNLDAFKRAIKNGLVGPTGQSGIKHIEGPLFELKIGGSAMRLLGLRNSEGIVVFTKFVREGLHKSNNQELIRSMLQ